MVNNKLVRHRPLLLFMQQYCNPCDSFVLPIIRAMMILCFGKQSERGKAPPILILHHWTEAEASLICEDESAKSDHAELFK